MSVSRAHEIEIRPSVASIISEPIAWITFKFWFVLSLAGPYAQTFLNLKKKMF